MTHTDFPAAVLFDLDNTLVDRDTSFLVWARWLVCEHAGVQEETRGSDIVRPLVDLDADGDGSREVIFHEMRRLHISQAGTFDEFVADYYREFVGRMSLDAGTQRLLDELQASAIPFGIVSNGGPTQLLKVRQLGLDKLTDCVYISALIGVEKPAAAIFRAAARCLGVDPHSLLFVGDDPAADIVGAAAVGMRTAWLLRGRNWPVLRGAMRPDYFIDTLEQLLSIQDFHWYRRD